MQIGIDFGTSYTAAAAYIDGAIEHISFGGDTQFQTVVFVPESPIDMSQFDPSSYSDKIRDSVAAAKSKHTAELKQYEEAASKIRAEYRKQVREGAISNVDASQKIDSALSALRKPILQPDHELKKTALGAIRRQWIQEQIAAGRERSINIDESAVFGEEAIEEFFAYGAGRLIQSPKSMLGFRLGKPQRDAIVDIITNILRHVRQAACQQLGVEVTGAIIGRPVTFRSSMGEKGSEQAISLIREASGKAGFTTVDFLPEPSAAAIKHHTQSEVAYRTVVVDVGGGTTDIALGLIGGGTDEPKIEKTWGIGKGGTDVDVGLSLMAVMPHFGKGQTKLLAPAFVDAAMVSDLNRQRDFRSNPLTHVPAPFLSRLRNLQQPGVTVRLNRDVEKLKIALSSERQAWATLDYIEKDFQVIVTQPELKEGYDRFMRSLNDLLQVVSTEVAGSAQVIFLTGGMSQSPYILEAVKKHFPSSRIVHGDPSLGVVGGLAVHAANNRSHS